MMKSVYNLSHTNTHTPDLCSKRPLQTHKVIQKSVINNLCAYCCDSFLICDYGFISRGKNNLLHENKCIYYIFSLIFSLQKVYRMLSEQIAPNARKNNEEMHAKWFSICKIIRRLIMLSSLRNTILKVFTVSNGTIKTEKHKPAKIFHRTWQA